MKNKLNVFTSRGLAGIVALKEKPSSIFKILPQDHNDDDDDGDDDDDVSIQNIANRIKEQIKKMTKIKTDYNTINIDNLFDECNSTLITFLYFFSSFDKNLNASLIGAIVTSVLTSLFSPWYFDS